jgi:hypothetical protein
MGWKIKAHGKSGLFMNDRREGITLKNYYNFDDPGNRLNGNLIAPDAWDAVRTENIGGNRPFFMDQDRAQWEKFCLSHQNARLRAQRLVELMGSRFTGVDSFGVGCACLEFLIKKENPHMQIRCSDYAPKSIERLRALFPEAEDVRVFDMLREPWPMVAKGRLFLLHRVDTEFSDAEWQEIFRKIRKAKAQDVLFIPSEILTAGTVWKKKIKYLISGIFGKKMVFAGYVRTQERFLSLMEESFHIKETVKIHDVMGFWLTPKEDENENR